MRAFWAEQRRTNSELRAAQEKGLKRFEDRLDTHDRRLTGVEKKLFWLAGVAAAGGGVIGSAAGQLFGG